MNAAAGPAEFAMRGSARAERRPVTMRGYAVREDGTSIVIELLDLSYEGCGIGTPEALRAGEKLMLSILRRGAIEAEVRWCAGGKAGLVFQTQQQPEKPQVQRRSARVPISAEVSLRRVGRGSFKVDIADLSPLGCRIALVERPSIGEPVLVKIDGLDVLEAQVCWVEGHMAGLLFKRPIHAAVFDLLIARLRG